MINLKKCSYCLLSIMALWGCMADTAKSPEQAASPTNTDSTALTQLQAWQDTVQHYANKLIEGPDDPEAEAKYCHALGGLPWFQVLAKQPVDAILTATIALERCPEKTWIVTNLALGYLYSNQYEAAENVYRQWKDRAWADSGNADPESYHTFGQAFLADLDYLEKIGFTHPDIPRIRTILK